MDNIINFLSGRNKKQEDADKYMQYWDKVKRMDAQDIQIPNTKNPSMESANALLGITPSPKAGLGKIAEDLYNGVYDVFHKDNSFKSPIPIPAQNVLGAESSTTPILTPTPEPQKIDFTGYTSKTLPEGKLPNVPSKDLTDLFFKNFGADNEATPAAAVTVGENAGFDPNAKSGVNSNGTIDYGLMQINSGTFDGLKKRRPKEMAAIGITSDTPYEVLFDPDINMQVAKLVRKDEQWAGQKPYKQWYGWQDPPFGKGINLQEMIDKLNKK